MREVHDLLAQLSALDIRIQRRGDNLHIDAPAGVITPELRSELEAHKAGLLVAISQPSSDAAKEGSLTSLALGARPDPLSLSFAQQRLWFLNRLEPHSAAYNISLATRLTGALNSDALERSLAAIVDRHEVLRTTFDAVNGQPVQRIHGRVELKVERVNLRHLSRAEQGAALRQLAQAEAARPFDLSKDVMLRSALLQLGDMEHVLLLTVHHIACDGWSTDIILGELNALYAAYATGQPPLLPALPLQYADFAVWQRRWLQGSVLERQTAYWRRQLDGIQPLHLPNDRSLESAKRHGGLAESLTLSASLTAALKSLSQSEGVTPFMTMLAAFGVLLMRLSGQDDITIGAPIANRTRGEVEPLIGFFVNTLVMRIDLSGDPSFCALLARVRHTALDAYDHQDLPFEKLVEELQPARSLQRNPLFDIFLNFDSGESGELALPGIHAEPIELPAVQPKFALTLYVSEVNERYELRLTYQVALFSRQRMAWLVRQFRFLLEQIIATPDAAISAYSLLAPGIQAMLPNPAVALPEPVYAATTAMFLDAAQRSPHLSAVCQGRRSWTYGELAGISKRLASMLLDCGLDRGQVIAVTGVPSLGLIAAMMATLLGGGVLLPIDRALPSQRRRFMLRQAKACFLLVVDDCHGNRLDDDEWMHEITDLSVIRVDAASGEANPGADFTHCATLPSIAPEDPAYIFFTSGTTGIPKGILGSHKGLSHFLCWQSETFGVGPGDRVTQLTGTSFDVILREVFTPLVSGATLCLPQEDEDVEPERVIGWLEREAITVLHVVPTMAHLWLSLCSVDASLTALRYVFFAGEPLTDALAQRWRARFPNSGELVNLYGPTETTMAKCFFRLPADLPYGIQPVGWPLPATQALVFGRSNRLCSIGEPGEIVLRTPFRTLGYLHAKEDAAPLFAPNPFRDDQNDLLYFTGDRGRYRPDGSLEILGRLDDQVKIRGVRIEPAEVAATLSQHPAVDACAVVAQQDDGDGVRLVAYFVEVEHAHATAAGLRSFLAERLPPVMIPSVFVLLEELPLTPNGKIDRTALPKHGPGERVLGLDRAVEFVAPATPEEKIVTAIWSEVLNAPRVGVYDNFFDLGGHSLLAMQVISRVRHVFQVEMPLRLLFEHPTIAGLAEQIAKRGSDDRTLDVEEIAIK